MKNTWNSPGERSPLFCFLFPVILLAAGVATTLGSADISIGEAYTAVLHKFFPDYFASDWLACTCVWDLRLPRILMGILAGTGLGVAGCIIQGVLRNPLASPYTLGISSGAGFGASLAILVGSGLAGGQYLVIGNAFLFALISSFIIIGLASRRGATPETMILAGIAMTCLFGSATTVLQYFGDAEAVKEAVFWMVGGPGPGVMAKTIHCGHGPGRLPSPALLENMGSQRYRRGRRIGPQPWHQRQARPDLFDDRIHPSGLQHVVCFTGTIGFIGLVAPHMVRMMIGGDNRFLVPASGLLGAVLLVVSDTVARRILAPIILPVGNLDRLFWGFPCFFT